MNLPTKKDLKMLMEKHEDLCISIYMPAERAGRETRKNPIMFKNLVAQAEKQLKTSGLSSQEIDRQLKPAQDLLQDSFFWQHQSDGLALFLSPERHSLYRVPYKFKKLTVVNQRFHIKPLLPLFSGDGRFYILALSQNQVRLLQGTHYSVSEVNLEGVPPNLSEALQYDNLEKHQQFHTETPHLTGKRSAMFHGHGGKPDEVKENILRYFQILDKALHEFLKEEIAPLVLAGVEYLLPLFKEANTYPYLAEKGVRGNPEELDDKALHEKAWTVVQPLFQEAQREALQQYKELVTKEKASSDLKAIVPAAYHRRVGILFVGVGIQIWGVFNPDTNMVCIEKKATPANEDLLDLAAVQTLLHGGAVYAMEPEKLPNKTPVAAIFRY